MHVRNTLSKHVTVIDNECENIIWIKVTGKTLGLKESVVGSV
jgi:hypothetical protein